MVQYIILQLQDREILPATPVGRSVVEFAVQKYPPLQISLGELIASISQYFPGSHPIGSELPRGQYWPVTYKVTRSS